MSFLYKTRAILSGAVDHFEPFYLQQSKNRKFRKIESFFMFFFIKFLHTRKYSNFARISQITSNSSSTKTKISIARLWEPESQRTEREIIGTCVAKHATLTKFWQIYRRQTDTTPITSNTHWISWTFPPQCYITRDGSTGGSTKSQEAPFRRGHIRASGVSFLRFWRRKDVRISISRITGVTAPVVAVRTIRQPRWRRRRWWWETSFADGGGEAGMKTHPRECGLRARACVTLFGSRGARARRAICSTRRRRHGAPVVDDESGRIWISTSVS